MILTMTLGVCVGCKEGVVLVDMADVRDEWANCISPRNFDNFWEEVRKIVRKCLH